MWIDQNHRASYYSKSSSILDVCSVFKIFLFFVSLFFLIFKLSFKSLIFNLFRIKFGSMESYLSGLADV